MQQQQQYKIAETIPRTTTPTAVNVPATLPVSEKNALLFSLAGEVEELSDSESDVVEGVSDGEVK